MNWEPDLRFPPHRNEIDKRNFGLQAARAMGFTHFIMMDCDEIYDHDEFKAERDRIAKTQQYDGYVCGCKVYIKEPTLQCSDHTLVPFIHKITPGLEFSFAFKGYPFAYDKNGAHIDPTRRLNIKSSVDFSRITMHHFSHVRKDIEQKMANSSARQNLTRSTLLEDYRNACPGGYSNFYRDTLREVPNRFNIHF